MPRNSLETNAYQLFDNDSPVRPRRREEAGYREKVSPSYVEAGDIKVKDELVKIRPPKPKVSGYRK